MIEQVEKIPAPATEVLNGNYFSEESFEEDCSPFEMDDMLMF
jgi:hypothetical protein